MKLDKITQITCICAVALFAIAATSYTILNVERRPRVERSTPEVSHTSSELVDEYVYMMAQRDVLLELSGTSDGYQGDVTDYPYTEGKGDAATGDIRIVRVGIDDWGWRKTPWDSGRHPVFQKLSEYVNELGIF